MRHQVAGRKFDRPTAARMAMYRNLVTSLLENEKIVTTEAKAKEIQAMAEKIIDAPHRHITSQLPCNLGRGSKRVQLQFHTYWYG